MLFDVVFSLLFRRIGRRVGPDVDDKSLGPGRVPVRQSPFRGGRGRAVPVSPAPRRFRSHPRRASSLRDGDQLSGASRLVHWFVQHLTRRRRSPCTCARRARARACTSRHAAGWRQHESVRRYHVVHTCAFVHVAHVTFVAHSRVNACHTHALRVTRVRWHECGAVRCGAGGGGLPG